MTFRGKNGRSVQYHAGQKLDPKFWWNSSYFCVSKLKVKYSFVLVNRKYFEDFHVSELKVKIRISFLPKSSKILNSYFHMFWLFYSIWRATKIRNILFDVFQARKTSNLNPWAFIWFWNINLWFSSFFLCCFFLLLKSKKIHVF